MFGDFTVGGSDSDETRIVRHTSGFAAAIPGTPTAHAGSIEPPTSDIRLTLADKPIEVSLRVDSVQTKLLLEPFAIALVGTYAQQRAVSAPAVRPSRGEELVDGSEAGARAIYQLAGQSDAMEWLSVVIQSSTPTDVWVVYQSVRFRRSDLNAVQFANVRTAMVGAQSWKDYPSTLRVWPDSKFATGSVALKLTEAAWADAERKSNELNEIDVEDVSALTDILIGVANNEHLPSSLVPKVVLDSIAGRIAGNAPTSTSVVLLRNLYDVHNMHDLRGWCWQSLWALGNRRQVRST